MFCKKCGNEVEEIANFCSKCGSSIGDVSQNAHGDGSVNFAGSNNIDNSNIHVGNIYDTSSQGDIAYIDRTYIKRLEIAGKQVKSSWLTFSGIIGFVGSLASIFSLWATNWQFIAIIIIGLSSTLFLSGVNLSRVRFIRLPISKYNLESDKDGLVFITKVSGDCPKCDGKLELIDIKIGPNRSKTVVRCNRYGKHIWDFDPTVLK